MPYSASDYVSIPSVFTEMIRSFVVLGETQNLSTAVEILEISRQTIRRHINALEKHKGIQLFEKNDRQYHLTKDGECALESAKQLIRQSAAWLNNTSCSFEGLSGTSIELNHQAWMYAQRHRLVAIWEYAPPIISSGLNAWFEARGAIDHEALESMQEYMLVYRKYRGEWLLVDFGNQSGYATWLGQSATKNELGRKLDLGTEYEPLIEGLRAPYEEVLLTGCARYEHIAYSMPLHKGGEPVPVQYQRLIAAGTFADSSPAVLVFSARTDVSEIPDRPEERNIKNRPESLMETEI